MDKTQYTNIAKAWEYAEEHALEREPEAIAAIRAQADQAGIRQGSAFQADLMGMMVRIAHASSAIIVGTGSLVETMQLAHALEGSGQLTAVDSTVQGITLIRRAFAALQDTTSTKLRAVNASADVFLPRLNANDYDLIVVAGDPANYTATYAQASRLLAEHGTIVFTDALALNEANGGVMNAADRSAKTVAMRQLIADIEEDSSFDTTLIPDGTGLLIATKR